MRYNSKPAFCETSRARGASSLDTPVTRGIADRRAIYIHKKRYPFNLNRCAFLLLRAIAGSARDVVARTIFAGRCGAAKPHHNDQKDHLAGQVPSGRLHKPHFRKDVASASVRFCVWLTNHSKSLIIILTLYAAALGQHRHGAPQPAKQVSSIGCGTLLASCPSVPPTPSWLGEERYVRRYSIHTNACR